MGLERGKPMASKKRSKKKYQDKRDWKTYNKQLILRGEFYINPRFLYTWREEIQEMNLKKEGNQYLYPNSLIEFLVILHSKSFDYRACEGILHALSKQHYKFPVISYTQICRRVNILDVDFETLQDHLIVGVDGSGMKVSNRGDWMRKKWKVRKGWVKVVVLGDTKGNIVDVRIGNENLNEAKASRGIVRRNKKKIKKLLGDGLYDQEATFDMCKELGIEPIIKIRKNASGNGMSSRAIYVQDYQERGYETWAEQQGYGMRWPATEGIFSAVKRMFGEYVRGVKKRYIYREARLKFWAYQQVRVHSMT